MNDARWRAKETDVAAIIGARHDDPFAILGLHRVDAGVVIRALVPDAERLVALDRDDKVIIDLERRDGSDFFEGLVKIPAKRFSYRLRAENSGGSWILHDPYAHGPVLGPMDDYLLVEGAHQRLYDRLGAHPMTHEGVEGTLFAVWAPNARRVSVVGDFNHWDGRRHQMRKRVDSGIWEIFAPGVGEGINYKYEIIGADGALLPLKADPFGFWPNCAPRPPLSSLAPTISNGTILST